MATRSQKVKLGIFLLLSAVLIVGIVVVFTGVSLFGSRARYTVEAADVAGLDTGAPVLIRGVRVGSVADTELFVTDKERVRVKLEIDPDVPIHGGAKAYLEFAGVTGLRLVNIRDGDPSRGRIEPGARLEYGETILEKLPDRGEALLDETIALLENANGVLRDLSSVTQTLDTSRIPAILRRTEELVEGLGETSTRLNRLVASTERPIAHTFEAAEATLGRVDGVAEQLDAAVTNVNSLIARVGSMVRSNDEEIRATINNLRQASQSFEALGRELRKRPNRLLFGGAPRERDLP